MAWYGLQFAENEPSDDADEATLDLEFSGAIITRISADGAAYGADLQVGDELLALEGFRFDPSALTERLKPYAAGDPVELLISRRGKLRTVTVPLGTAAQRSYDLTVDPKASALQKRHLEALLKSTTPQEP